MKTISPTTTAGHSAFQRLTLMISLYFGLAMIAHQNPELTRRRTHSMTTPALATNNDNDNNNNTSKANKPSTGTHINNKLQAQNKAQTNVIVRRKSNNPRTLRMTMEAWTPPTRNGASPAKR